MASAGTGCTGWSLSAEVRRRVAKTGWVVTRFVPARCHARGSGPSCPASYGEAPHHPSRSPEDFAGRPACGPGELRGDLERLVFLLGGNDGEQFFGA
jgi:hypothetical protein